MIVDIEVGTRDTGVFKIFDYRIPYNGLGPFSNDIVSRGYVTMLNAGLNGETYIFNMSNVTYIKIKEK